MEPGILSQMSQNKNERDTKAISGGNDDVNGSAMTRAEAKELEEEQTASRDSNVDVKGRARLQT